MYHYEVVEVHNLGTGKTRWYVNGKRVTPFMAGHVVRSAIASGTCDCFASWTQDGKSYDSKQCRIPFSVS